MPAATARRGLLLARAAGNTGLLSKMEMEDLL